MFFCSCARRVFIYTINVKHFHPILKFEFALNERNTERVKMDKMALIPAEQRSAMQRQVFFFSIFCIEYYFPFLRIASLLIVFAESLSVFVVLLIKNGKKRGRMLRLVTELKDVSLRSVSFKIYVIGYVNCRCLYKKKQSLFSLVYD